LPLVAPVSSRNRSPNGIFVNPLVSQLYSLEMKVSRTAVEVVVVVQSDHIAEAYDDLWDLEVR
jgi:hypothetical protein